jgi:hypothetical protein
LSLTEMSANTSSSCSAVQNTASSYIIPAGRFCAHKEHQQRQFLSEEHITAGSTMLAGSGQGRTMRCDDTSTQSWALLLRILAVHLC